MPLKTCVGAENPVAAVLVTQYLQVGCGRGRREEELVDLPWRPVDEEQLCLPDRDPAPVGELPHVRFELGRAATLGVAVRKGGEVVVPRVGVSAVAVPPVSGQGLLVVPLDGPHTA